MRDIFGIVRSQDNKTLKCNLNNSFRQLKKSFDILIKYLMILSEADRINVFLVKVHALKFSHRLRIESKRSYGQITMNIKHLQTMCTRGKSYSQMLTSWLSLCRSLLRTAPASPAPRFYPGRGVISIYLQLKTNFKDLLIIVKFLLYLTATGMERLKRNCNPKTEMHNFIFETSGEF